ncbi:hypothetical protein [Paenibacillus sp. RC67]|uniref:hypothetical protein n=1 Tax=Paenibacillus sp. RC67 TaxID=3039392 RepID=UPI0024ACAF8A|nr:hypothetical protein [Paenibacillus sp. RC67]
MNHLQSLSDKMSKKDLIYGFIIVDLTILLLAVAVWKFHTSREVIDQISLGSALTTILLAVVAMVYSYIQTLEASAQNRMVQQALGKISEKVDEFGKMKEELITLRQDTRTYNEHILESLNRFVEEGADHIDSIFKVLRERGLEVPEEVEKDIAAAYRDKFNSELAVIRSRFIESQEKQLTRELIALVQNNLQSGYEVTLLELVDLLVYKGGRI